MCVSMNGNCAVCGSVIYKGSRGNRKYCKKCAERVAIERHREHNKKWRLANPQANAKHRLTYRTLHPEAHKQQNRAWGKSHRSSIVIRMRLWRARHIESERERQRKWGATHPERIKAKSHARRGAEGSFTADELKAKFEAMGNKCAHCGATDKKLTVDHITPLKLGGTNYIDNIQPPCKSCNSRKGAKFVG